MSSIVSDKVFENKYTKLKVLAILTLKYAFYLALIYGLLLLYALNKRIDDPYKFTKNYWLIFLAVSVVGILVKMVLQKDVNVTVLRKTVDITVGDTNAVYQVTDYIGPNIKKSGKKNARFELVFANNEKDAATDSDIRITLPGISIRQFMEISDAVMTAKQELSGGIEYEAFQGNVYEGNRKSSVDLKFVFIMFFVIAIPVRMIIHVLVYFLSSDMVLGTLVLFLVVLSLIYIIVLINFFRYLPVKEPGSKPLRTLEFESTGLKINNKSYSYKDIESVTMTPPYLTGFSRYHRMLSVKLYEAKKPMRFSLGKRIGKNTTEEEFASGCTCLYPALYERIKSDKALTRKFKI